MLGNATGWLISGLIVMGTALSLVWLDFQRGQLTEETTFLQDSRNLAVMALPIDPKTIVQMNGPEDAGSLYRQAVQEYLEHKPMYEEFCNKGKSTDPIISQLKAMDLLVTATHASRATIFEKNPQEVVNYQVEREPLEVLDKLGQAMINRMAMGNVKRDPQQATKYAEAVFALGHKLFEERLIYFEYHKGTGLMGSGAYVLRELAVAAGDSARAAKIKDFDEARMKFDKEYVTPIRAIVARISDVSIATDAGNVFGLAKRSRERMWRTEATLRMGLYKYNANTFGDQQGAKDLLAKWSVDPALDPVVRTAATAAHELTLDAYRNLR